MAKKVEDRTFNISVIGLSGTEKDKGVVGVGKSCLCNRFIYQVADKYFRDHISVLSQSDFAGRVINNDHFLYWGEVTKLDDGNNFTFHVIEQSEFIDDVSFQPFKTGRDPYIKRCVATKVQSAEKLMYICKDQLGMETDSAYVQKLMPEGKLNIDGFLLCFDVSKVEQRSLEQQVDFVSHLISGAIKTKKPVVLVTTKNDEANERYVKEAEKLASRKENKTNIPLIGTSAHENVNVEQAFMTLAHMIDKSKTRPKITPVAEAFKQRREVLDVATEAYKGLLRTNVVDPKALWNVTRKKMEKESDFGHYIDLFGSDSARKLFRQHTKYLRDEQIRKREQHFISKLPDILQHFLPDLPTIADRAWTACQRYIAQHQDFEQYFVNVCEEGESWKHTDDFLDNYQETRLPFDLLTSSEAESCFRNHVNALQAENRKLELKRTFKKLLEENNQVTPGKPLEDVYIYFVGKECFNELKPHEREQVYREHQRELELSAKHEFQELLWEKSEVFIRMLHTTDTYTAEDIKEIVHSMDTDSRYRLLDRMNEERQLILLKHLGFMECPDSNKCYFQNKCAKPLIQEVLTARTVSRPESQNVTPQVTEKSYKPLNLVLLGTENLATELYKEIRNVYLQDEFQYGHTVYSLDYRPIEEDVSRDYNAFATANFQPHGCICVYSTRHSYEYVQSSLETTLLTDLRRETEQTLQSLPIVIIHAFNHQATEKEQYILSDYGQQLAKRLQCAFIDIPSEEYVMDHSKFSPVQIEDALSALVSGSLYGTHSRSWSEDLEPDLRIGMCVMCGDPFPVDVPLGPLLNSSPTNIDDSQLVITLETNLDNSPDFSKQKVEISIGSYHTFVAKIFKPTEEEEDILYHGFILVFSTKRKASFCIMKAFAESLRMQMSIMPILILAVTDTSVGSSIFFTDEFSQYMISEGNKVADHLGAEFKMTTANFQQQTPIYIPFLKEAWLKHDEITGSFYCEPSSPPAYVDHIDRRPPAPLPSQYDTYQTTKSSTSNSQSTEDSEPIYEVPHQPLLSDSEHERPSSTSPPPFTAGHSRDHFTVSDLKHSELLVKPSMIKKRQGTNADSHKEQYRTSYSAIESDIVKIQSDMNLEQTEVDREPHYQFRKSSSMKFALTEEEEAWALNEPRRPKKASTFPSDGRQNSRDNGSWSEQSRHASTGSRESEEIMWEPNEMYSTGSTLEQRKSHLYTARHRSKGSIQAPLAIPEPTIEIATDYATVQDVIRDYAQPENDYALVTDALPEGHFQRIKSTSRKKEKDGTTEDSEDSEFSSLERDKKDLYSRVNRKPTPHKKRNKQKSHDSQVFTVYSDEKQVTGRHLVIARDHPDRERSNSPSEGSEGTSDETQLVPKGKKRSFKKKSKWRSPGSESSSHGTFSPQLSDENLIGSPTSHIYDSVKDTGFRSGPTWSMTSSVDGEIDLNDSGNWKDKKYQKDTLRKQKKEEKRIQDAERRRQKEEERKKREEQKLQKKNVKKIRPSGGAEGGIRLSDCIMSSNNPSLPQFIETCVEYIETEGMNTEGIYRIPGNKAQVDLLQNKFLEDPNLDIASLEIQVNAVATVLKTFLKESEPLIPFSLHEELLEAAGMPDKSTRLLALRGVLQKLHPLNWEVLKYFITHLNRVSKQKENHNMDSRNLALCLWPTIIRIDFQSYDKMAQGTRIPPEIVQTLIDQYGFFFHGDNEV